MTDIAEGINSQTYLEEGLHQIVESIRKLFDCRTIAVVLTDPESEYLKIKISRGLSKTFADNYQRRVGTGVIGETIWAGKTILIEQADTSDPAYEELKLENDFVSAICAPIVAQFRPLGYIYCDCDKPGTFDQECLTTLSFLANLAALAADKDRMYTLNKKLRRLDEKTMILRCEAFFEDLEKELLRELRYKEPLSLLLLDIDNFKDWKDLYGAESAARLFADVVKVIKSCARGMDVIGRYGVDEVIICMPRADKEGALRLAERIRDSISTYKFEHDDPQTTVSIGVAAVTQERRDQKSLMEAARTALLHAQRDESISISAL
jgi:diguanylate cyclase (GGDEF)-like protein